jgi:hypothetical protein
VPNTSDVDQTGTGEIAVVNQSGTGTNTSDIEQDGTGNDAFVDQISEPGDTNSSIIKQGVGSLSNTADVEQTGEGNDSDISQDGSLSTVVSPRPAPTTPRLWCRTR